MSGRSRRLSRRRFLQAAGGAIVALPLLESLRARADVPTFPKRLILIYNPNGTIQDEFWPTNVTSETSFELGQITEPLARHHDRLLLLKGLSIAVSDIGPGGPHQKGIGGLYTGRELLEGEFVDGDGSRAGWANGISVDQRVVQAMGAATTLPSLELAVRSMKSDVQSRISYAGPSRPLPPINDPHQVYTRLFSGLDAEPATFDARRERRRSVLDTVQEQFKALDSRLDAADKEKLEQHTALIRDIEQRLDLVPAGGAACLPPAEPPQLAVDSADTMPDISELQIDLLVAALACDMTRVASLQFSDGFNRIRFPWVGSMGEGHTLSHAGDSNTQARQELIDRSRWYATKIARLLDQLSGIPEGDGSMLDNTLIVWGNEIGVGNTHSHDNIPFMLAGSAGGAIETGRFIDFGGRSHNDLLVSILNAMDVDTDTFGHPDYVTGPLPGLV